MSDSLADKTSLFLSKLGATTKSLVKTALAGGRSKVKNRHPAGRLIIMGNGPSLRKNLDENLGLLRHCDTVAVNFAANAPDFNEIKPKYYVLADPHFFKSENDPNVQLLIRNIIASTWHMTLFIPKNCTIWPSLEKHPYISVEFFNFNGIEGFECFENIAFDMKWGMPRPRNVLIPSIMIGIWMGYKEIYLIGADHTWTRTLSVDETNHVVSVQPHFYKENEHEKSRITSTYNNIRMHDILESFSVAFKSYHTIQRYASLRGIKIFNSTPESFIDAFERRPLLSSH